MNRQGLQEAAQDPALKIHHRCARRFLSALTGDIPAGAVNVDRLDSCAVVTTGHAGRIATADTRALPAF